MDTQDNFQEEVLDTEIQGSTPDEELDLELEQEEAPPEADGDVEALKQRNAELEAKNRKLYARLKKGEQKPSNKPVQQTESTDEEIDVRKTVAQLALAERKRQFGYEHNLSPMETDAVFRLNPKPTSDTLKDPFVQGGLEKLRAQQRVKDATPSSSGRSQTINGKSLQDMDDNEANKNYSTLVQRAVQNRRK